VTDVADDRLMLHRGHVVTEIHVTVAGCVTKTSPSVITLSACGLEALHRACSAQIGSISVMITRAP